MHPYIELYPDWDSVFQDKAHLLPIAAEELGVPVEFIPPLDVELPTDEHIERAGELFGNEIQRLNKGRHNMPGYEQGRAMARAAVEDGGRVLVVHGDLLQVNDVFARFHLYKDAEEDS